MSIKGSDYRWLRDALSRGDLPLVKATVAHLPAVALTTALEIAILICDREPENGRRAAVRWLGRFCLEQRDVTLAQVREALDAFAVLVEDPDGAEGILRRITAD